MRFVHIFFAILISLFYSCDQNCVYEKNTEIPDYIWDYDFKVPFEVEVTDTGARYNVYVNIRHTDAYPYSNLWVVIHTELPSGEKKQKRVQLVLSDNKGQFFGQGMGDIWDCSLMIQENAIFPQAGTYRFQLEQSMRQNPLPFVMAMGIMVEKNSNPRQ